MIAIDEPFKNLMTQGMVKDEHSDTMSKVKNWRYLCHWAPQLRITMRLAILFVAPPEGFDWDEKVVAGAYRFIKRAWRVVLGLSHAPHDASAMLIQLWMKKSLESNHVLNAMESNCTTEFDKGPV